MTGSPLDRGESTGEIVTPPDERLPVIDPAALLCIGLNYRLHAEEMNAPILRHPVLFFKNPSAATGHGQAIELPRHLRSDRVDYECELAVVIGRPCKNVSPDEALNHVLGFTCGNDVSAGTGKKNTVAVNGAAANRSIPSAPSARNSSIRLRSPTCKTCGSKPG